MTDVLVIGAGLGGMAAAIELASRGHRVRILEAQPEVGGKAGIVEIDGVELDTGPSLLTMPDVFDRLFRAAGSSLEDEIELLSPEPWFEYRWPDGARLAVHHHREDTLAEVGRSLGSLAERELRAYLDHAANIWEAAAPTFVLGQAPTVTAVARLGLRAVTLISRIDPLRTLRASIRAHVSEPHLRDVLERYATYNGSDPRRAPATLGCIAHVELTLGGYGVRGGVRALVLALARACHRLGVEIETGARVTRIIHGGERPTGVELESGEQRGARAVIGNADPVHVLGALTGGRPPRLEPSMSGWNAIVKAHRQPAATHVSRAAHTVLFSGDYDRELEDIFDRDHPPALPTIYLCAPERAHARRAGWPGHEPLFLMTNAPPEPATGDRPAGLWDATRTAVLHTLRRHHLLHADDPIVWERSPADLARTYPGTRGAIYGSSSSSLTSAFLRPPNIVSRYPGLFLGSGGAHPGGGMPLAALSGIAAARAAHSFLGWRAVGAGPLDAAAVSWLPRGREHR